MWLKLTEKKNIEARQNVTGFLKKKSVYWSIPKKSIPKIKSSYQKLNVPHRKTNAANVGQNALSYVGPSL